MFEGQLTPYNRAIARLDLPGINFENKDLEIVLDQHSKHSLINVRDLNLILRKETPKAVKN